jgi:hypothetical protein
MTIPDNKKKLINESIMLCNDALEAFYKTTDQETDKGVKKALDSLVEQNGYFAGGMFRSIFSGTPVNDLDFFFEFPEAAEEFASLMMFKAQSLKCPVITSNLTFNFDLNIKGQKQCFSVITHLSQEMNDITREFDVTANMNAFKPSTFEMKFNRGTFEKKFIVRQIKDPFSTFNRVVRFMNAGFTVNPSSLRRIIGDMDVRSREVSNQKQSALLGRMLETVTEEVTSSGYRQQIPHSDYFICQEYYTGQNYFEPIRKPRYTSNPTGTIEIRPDWRTGLGTTHTATTRGNTVPPNWIVEAATQAREQEEAWIRNVHRFDVPREVPAGIEGRRAHTIIQDEITIQPARGTHRTIAVGTRLDADEIDDIMEEIDFDEDDEDERF